MDCCPLHPARKERAKQCFVASGRACWRPPHSSSGLRRCCRASGDKTPAREEGKGFPLTTRQASLSQPVAYKTNHTLVPTPPADPAGPHHRPTANRQMDAGHMLDASLLLYAPAPCPAGGAHGRPRWSAPRAAAAPYARPPNLWPASICRPGDGPYADCSCLFGVD
jgi:hypothetical protein